MVGDELLSAFKVASFAIDEDEPVSMPVGSRTTPADTEDETREWDAIIPENVRKKIDQEQREKEMADLYLPPRRGRGPQQSGKEEGNARRSRKKDADDDDDESDEASEDASDGEERPKKRGRPRVNAKDGVKGFTDAEVRRFVKSFRKFSAPLHRLEAVAGDAELQEKPLSDLKKLGELILQRCQEALLSQKSGIKDSLAADDDSGGQTAGGRKKRERGPSLKISNVSLNAKTYLAHLNELEPLAHILPANKDERKNFILPTKVRDAHWDIQWSNEEDSKLLRGIFDYGLGSWEAIKMDPGLGLTQIILPDGHDAKPQAKHLLNRAEYLLKLLGKMYEQQQGKPKPQRGRKSKAISKAVIETEDISSVEDFALTSPAGGAATGAATGAGGRRSSAKVKKEAKVKTEDEDSHGVRTEDERVVEKERKKEKSAKKEKKKKKDVGPMHFTASSEPRAVEIIGDLDPVIFQEVRLISLIYSADRCINSNKTDIVISIRIIDHKPSSYWLKIELGKMNSNCWFNANISNCFEFIESF